MSMLLRSDFAAHQGIPKEYTLEIPSDETVKNTFVFTEQDLPGFKSKSRQKFEATTANMPARLTRVKTDKNKAPYDPNKKFTPFVRKSVPSKLSFAGSSCETDYHQQNAQSWLEEFGMNLTL